MSDACIAAAGPALRQNANIGLSERSDRFDTSAYETRPGTSNCGM